MAKTPEELKAEKALAAALAAGWVRPGMRLGIGSGSTVGLFVEALGRRCAGEGLEVHCVVASAATARQAAEAGLKVAGFEIGLPLDLAVDGADEIGPRLELTKGGGGAMLRERIVAAAGRRVLIVGDSSKPVQQLGHFPLPVEVFPFGVALARAARVGRNSVSGKVVELLSAPDATFADVAHLVRGAQGRTVLETGDLDAGLVWAGQVRGLIHDIPTCAALIGRTMAEAEEIITRRLSGFVAAAV